jgi:hypothetical protein
VGAKPFHHEKNTPLPCLFLLLAALFVPALPASASLIAYEGFDLASGEDALASGAGSTSTGFAGNWSASPANDVVASSLSYGLLQTAGGAAVTDANGFDTGSLRSLTAGQSGTIWVSVLFQSTLSPSGFAGLTLRTAGNDNGALALGHQFGGSFAGMWGDSLTNASSNASTVSASGMNFLVAELNLAAGTGTFYVNPTGLGTGAAPAGAAYSTSVTFTSGLTVTGIGLRGNTVATFDEIRLGTSWADVSPSAVPEPSSYAAIAGAALLGFAVWRRRR